ncbi:hypothetical protein IM774_09140 [Erysipelotrichaceae bacterium RD49]|nr:hypothetical protein [Erysipelotrichaceae bacterium RD49]
MDRKPKRSIPEKSLNIESKGERDFKNQLFFNNFFTNLPESLKIERKRDGNEEKRLSFVKTANRIADERGSKNSHWLSLNNLFWSGIASAAPHQSHWSRCTKYEIFYWMKSEGKVKGRVMNG